MERGMFGILMVLTGLLGLFATACGLFFLQYGGMGLIGVIPGALLLWATVKIWTVLKARGSTPQPVQAPQAQPDRNENP